MPAGCCAVSSAQDCVGILGKWNLCHVFLCPDDAGDLSEGLGKGSWFPSVSLNSSSYILMHTHGCFMWLEAEGNTCHCSWAQSSQSSKEIQGWRSVLGLGKKVLDPSGGFFPVVHALVLMSQLCLQHGNTWRQIFPLTSWLPFIPESCAGVTSGTWHPWALCLVSCPTFSPLFDLGLMNFFVYGTFLKWGFSYAQIVCSLFYTQ